MRGAMGFVVSLAIIVAVGAVIFFGLRAKDSYDKAQVAPQARAHWRVVKAEVARRVVNGQYPLELGAVWQTHRGRVCGLVNGGSAFGGLTGMMPFYQDASGLHFKIETDQQTFADGWRDCNDDLWFELEQGSYEVGYCATKRGASRCHTEG